MVYFWRVNASNFFGTSDWSGQMIFMTQLASMNPFDSLCEHDSDCDGIPDDEEINRFNTDPKKKTLFVRPKKESIYETKYVYWEEFIKLFPDSRPGFANLPPFTDAEIEIVVVGNEDPNFPYEPMRHFAYDPANDPNKPHCNILEVVLRMEKDSQGKGITLIWGPQTGTAGHTFFYLNQIWSWDTKGYTPGNVVHHGYFIPEIYPFPLNNYLKEGAYRNNIAQGEMPKTLICNEADCGPNQANRRSPMNLSGNSPNYGPPDNTVEFNEIFFDPNGRITFVGGKGDEYSRDEVLKRTIVHEMGHAITGFDGFEHCKNPQCIMYEATENWKMLNFGHSNDCSHKERMKAGVQNEIHP
jgi:hypothetical protein